jgi:hypothetical protein
VRQRPPHSALQAVGPPSSVPPHHGGHHATLPGRTQLPEGLAIPVDDRGAKTCRVVVDGNATEGVTWVHSYVTPDKQRTFCIYDGPSPEAIRRAAETNQLPVDRITQVQVLDPYFYR